MASVRAELALTFAGALTLTIPAAKAVKAGVFLDDEDFLRRHPRRLLDGHILLLDGPCHALRRALFEKAQHFAAQAVIHRLLAQAQPVARPLEGHVENVAHRRRRAVGHHDDAVGEQQCFVDVMGDHQDGLLLLSAQTNHLVLQLHAGDQVEQAERLVEQQHLRLQGQGARDADALAHAGGKLVRIGIGITIESDGKKIFIREAAPDALRLALLALIDGEQDIFPRREPGQQAED